MKKVLLITICMVMIFVFSSCSSSVSKENSNESESVNINNLQFEGDYLIKSVELSEKNNFIDNITIADNNFQSINAFEESVLKSIHIYEAEVIWDMDNKCFRLDKGYDIGDSGIVFNNTNLMYGSSIDTGEKSWHIDKENWEFENLKIYNFCCSVDDKKFDSYFIYESEQKNKLLPITESQLEYSYVNCIIQDSSLYLAKFTGEMTGNDASEPEFECYGDAIANFVMVEDDSY